MHGLVELEDHAAITSPMDLELVVLPFLGLSVMGLNRLHRMFMTAV